MRVSVDSSDAGYQAFLRLGGYGAGIEVFIDGRRLRNCVTADSKLGSVTIYEEDDEGRIMLNAKRNAARRKRLFGRVEIRTRRHEG